MALPHAQWKNVKITNADGALDLQDGDSLKIVMESSDLKVKLDRSGTISPWGDGCVCTTQLIVVKGRHIASGRYFEITCTHAAGGNWSQTGILTLHLTPFVGGNGTWTAEEGP